MKTVPILIAMLVACSCLYAQSPVITQAHQFATGDSALIYSRSDGFLSAFSPGPGGADVSWDFSAMSFDSAWVGVDTLRFIDPAGTPFYPVTLSADYSASNLCVFRTTDPFNPGNQDYAYYSVSSDSLAFIGHWADNGGSELWEDHCADPIRELAFPMEHGDVFTDAFERFYFDMSGSDGHYITGMHTVHADGYGSLVTPDQTLVENALRVHSILSYTDSNAIFGIETYTWHTYRWYAEGKKGFILSLEMLNDSVTILKAEYQKQTDFNTGNAVVEQAPLSVYPNPSGGTFYISSASEILSAELYDYSGQRIAASFNLHEPASVTLQQPCSGIYLLSLRMQEGTRWQKLVME